MLTYWSLEAELLNMFHYIVRKDRKKVLGCSATSEARTGLALCAYKILIYYIYHTKLKLQDEGATSQLWISII